MKAAFEKSDFGTNAVVSVVTHGVSDDANGCNIDADSVWLQVARAGNNFAIHYSLDGEKFDMVRIFHLPAEQTVKVGLEAQSPTGEGGYRYYSDLSLGEKNTLGSARRSLIISSGSCNKDPGCPLKKTGYYLKQTQTSHEMLQSRSRNNSEGSRCSKSLRTSGTIFAAEQTSCRCRDRRTISVLPGSARPVIGGEPMG